MEKVTSVSSLKASLSAYLNLVKSGEQILVTERGKPVARLVPYLPGIDSEEERLQRLFCEGTMRPGNGECVVDFLRNHRPATCQTSVVDALLEEREEGW